MKIRTVILTQITCLWLSFTGTACSDGPTDTLPSDRDHTEWTDSTTTRTLNVTLTLDQCHETDGEPWQPSWTSSDPVRLLVLGPESKEITVGSVSVTGTAVLEGCPQCILMSCYPPSYPVTINGYTVRTEIPAIQDGTQAPLFIGFHSLGSNDTNCDIRLKPVNATLSLHIPQEPYTISHICITANAKEALAGKLDIFTAIGGSTVPRSNVIEVRPTEAVDCSQSAQMITVTAAPVTLSQGITITAYLTDGSSAVTSLKTPVTLKGGVPYSLALSLDRIIPASNELMVCGDDRVIALDADKAISSGYSDAITWSWDAKPAADLLGLNRDRMDHIDECKPVDNGSRLLITSSYGWCILFDRATSEILFHTVLTPHAHSAELLPGNLIAVACSTGSGAGYNCIQLYDLAHANGKLGEYPLTSAHGVVWNNATQKLYAAGDNTLQVYSLAGKSLVLEKTVTTPQKSVHDLTYVDENFKVEQN